MDIFLLGAGRPADGRKPSALKNIAQNTNALDWQTHCFSEVAIESDIHFLGGYQVEQILLRYPRLNITVVPDWQDSSSLETFLKCPFSEKPAFIAYADTVFRKETVAQMNEVDADVVFGVDSLWTQRYVGRSASDISHAETLTVVGDGQSAVEHEFTGLVRLSEKAISYIQGMDDGEIEGSFLDLIDYLRTTDLTVASFDVAGNWAEFNSPMDIAHFVLGTKADTLARLEPLVRTCKIGKQVTFTRLDWQASVDKVLANIRSQFSDARLVVRSSSKGEDNWDSSNAGGYESILNVDGTDPKNVTEAINAVIESYSGNENNDQVLVQEFLTNVRAAGVVFTCGLENNAPYYRFNFDDKSQSTESVTAGTHDDLRTVLVSRLKPETLETAVPELMPVMIAVQELEKLLGYDKLDIEFAISEIGEVHIFQVRPVTVDHSAFDFDFDNFSECLKSSVARFNSLQPSLGFVYGDRAVFANMPDWNPAEIIGTRPKTLAFSLYRYLITNDIWAKQRQEFGYRNVRPYPLIVSFVGQPYVDTRASFNSFIPATVSDDSALRIANAYINILADNPHLHDKVEFDVAFTIWTPDFLERAKARLMPYGVSDLDIEALGVALRDLTSAALVRLNTDVLSIEAMNSRRADILGGDLSYIDKAFGLLDDCKNYGTLAFSHAARAGFVSSTIMKSLVADGVFTASRKDLFLTSFKTVAGDFQIAKAAYGEGEISLEALLEGFGHLRPGTYEVATPAYWENPDLYLVSDEMDSAHNPAPFALNDHEREGIKAFGARLGTPLSPDNILTYMVEATQAREFVKFEFTKNLSAALDMIVLAADSLGIDRTAASFLDYQDILDLKVNSINIERLKNTIKQRMSEYEITSLVELPSVIIKEDDFYCFERMASKPNFVTLNKCLASVYAYKESEGVNLNGMIVLVPQADPGYDWLFGQGIAGLITKYGGANSHMAIRAAEIGLPAAIGVGEKLYEKISKMAKVELDCANQLIRELQ